MKIKLLLLATLMAGITSCVDVFVDEPPAENRIGIPIIVYNESTADLTGIELTIGTKVDGIFMPSETLFVVDLDYSPNTNGDSPYYNKRWTPDLTLIDQAHFKLTVDGKEPRFLYFEEGYLQIPKDKIISSYATPDILVKISIKD